MQMLLVILRYFPENFAVHKVWVPVSYFMTPALEEERLLRGHGPKFWMIKIPCLEYSLW